MKNLFGLLIAGLLTIGTSNAQDGARQNRTAEEMAKMQVERLTEQLTLNKSQQDSVYKYVLLASKEQKKVMKNAGDDREAAFEKMGKMRAENSTKIKTFLTADQVKKYEELEKSRPQRGNRRNN